MSRTKAGRKENLVERRRELWRPPLFTEHRSQWQTITSAIRRFFDLQAASIWGDLKTELPAVVGSVLDVGSGAQPYRRLLPPGTAYLGIDTEDARKAFGYEVPGTRYYSGDAFPVETGTIDFILCTETLEHVLEPARFLREMRRCLRKGGRVMLTVPFSARWHFIPRDYWRFTPSGLAHLMQQAGFSDVEVYARGNQLTVACHKALTLLYAFIFGRLFRPLAWLTAPLAAPFIAFLAIVAHFSLRFSGGDDCLGYTVKALHPRDEPLVHKAEES